MRLNEAKTVDQMIDAEIALGRREFRFVGMLQVAEMTKAWMRENRSLALAALFLSMEKHQTDERIASLIVQRLTDPKMARIKETDIISQIVTGIMPRIHDELRMRFAERATELAA